MSTSLIFKRNLMVLNPSQAVRYYRSRFSSLMVAKYAENGRHWSLGRPKAANEEKVDPKTCAGYKLGVKFGMEVVETLESPYMVIGMYLGRPKAANKEKVDPKTCAGYKFGVKFGMEVVETLESQFMVIGIHL